MAKVINLDDHRPREVYPLYCGECGEGECWMVDVKTGEILCTWCNTWATGVTCSIKIPPDDEV